MPTCTTNCVEKPLGQGFSRFGRVVGTFPCVFVFASLTVSACLGGGFYFLHEREAKGIEKQFTPINGRGKMERDIVQKYFPHGEEFSQFRLYTEGVYASVILVNPVNILTASALNVITTLDRRVKDIHTPSNITFSDICAKTKGRCFPLTGLNILKRSVNKSVTYPVHDGEFLGTVLGGVSLKQHSNITKSANAIRLFYHLKEDNKTKNEEWLKAFIANVSREKFPNMSVSYFTSISREEEFESTTKTVIPFFSITYFLAISISIISCTRFDCVRNKVWVASLGVISAGLAVLSSFGLLLYCDVPFSVTAANAPFLILGIGVDDMFIMISCWQKTKVHDKVEDRMAETYREAAVSITITTLTDALAFYIGLLTPFLSVQSFCMYTGTAVLFCYIYNITFFGACLALNGQREQSNRHWLTCMVVQKPNESGQHNPCCVGGAYNPETGAEEETPMNIFFGKYYGPFVTKRWAKVLVTLLYLGYLSASIYGCLQMKEGIDLKNLAPDGSYVGSYYEDEDRYFSDYGPNVMLVINDETFKYWNECSREGLTMCMKEFEKSDMVAPSNSLVWLDFYLRHGREHHFNISDESAFIGKLPTFLNISGFSADVNISDGKIHASRIFIQTINVRTAVDEKNMLDFFRVTAEKCSQRMGVQILVYHPAFIYFDQYAVIVTNTIQNVVIATLAMLVISLLLIPNPVCSLWVTFAIASVIVGVAGFMALWDVNLDSISMINLVICIGFSVDFSAHISYAFVSSNKKGANEKAIDALHSLGYPIIQGAVSTIAGIVVLSASESYIFRTFFKIMFLVISFGALHGIMFLPVFLTFCGCCSDSSRVEEVKAQSILGEVYTNTGVHITCATASTNETKNGSGKGQEDIGLPKTNQHNHFPHRNGTLQTPSSTPDYGCCSDDSRVKDEKDQSMFGGAANIGVHKMRATATNNETTKGSGKGQEDIPKASQHCHLPGRTPYVYDPDCP